jgi:zinc transporter, ZIP family
MAAVFLANVPESLGSTAAMQQEGRSRGYIIGVWSGVAVACVLATMAGYALLAGLSPGSVSAVLALAAGGILALLADTMLPRPLSTAAGGSRWPPPSASPAPSCSAS